MKTKPTHLSVRAGLLAGELVAADADSCGRRERRAYVCSLPSTTAHFSVLEIADTHTKPEEVLLREAHWKDVLVSRHHGNNGN